MTDRWLERARSDLLDVPYHHLVFTIRRELRNVFAWHRPLLGMLFYAVKATVLEWCRTEAGYICVVSAQQSCDGIF